METPPKPPEIREKARTGCVVFLMSAGTGIGMYVLAELLFAPADERGMSMQFFAILIGVVGVAWSIWLTMRSVRVSIEDRLIHKSEAEAARIRKDFSAGATTFVISAVLGAINLYTQSQGSHGLGCCALVVAGYGIAWSVKFLVGTYDELLKE